MNAALSQFWAGFPNLRGSIFIVTYGRSGSTLVQTLVQSVDGAHFTGENYFSLFPLMQSCRRVQDIKEDWGQKNLAPNRPWYGANRVRPNLYHAACIESYVTHVMRPPKQARWIGFKEIRYAQADDQFDDFLDFIRESFPNARFIFNSRDAQEVSKSRWFKKWPFEKVRNLIGDMDARFAAYHAVHPNISVHLNYQDYSSDPMGFKPVFDLIDEPFVVEEINALLDTKLSH